MNSRTVHCALLDQDAEGLEKAPFPGKLGQKIFENISKEAWNLWVAQQTRLINEYRLNLVEPQAKEFLSQQMENFLFGEQTMEQEKTQAVEWSYDDKTGPKQWGQLSDEFALCKTGKHQSPINIKNAVVDTAHSLKFAYDTSPLHVKLNEHSLYVHFFDDAPDEIVLFEEGEYKLIQLHFHAPSEHFLDDQKYPMEVHLVHQNKAGKFLVVGLFIQAGGANDYLDTLFANLPVSPSEEIVAFETFLNPMDLLPEDKTFYHYTGSLTTPPCSEEVTWIVMKESIEASDAQIQHFKQDIIDENVRPLQPLNDRTITLHQDS